MESSINISVGNFVFDVRGANLQHACEAFGAVASVKVIKGQCSGQERENVGEGQTTIVEYRWAEGSEARLRDLAAELVQLPVDEGEHHAVYALQEL
jgi:hypothetical protein